ncbi:MAG: hypothetical protein NWR72_15255 [Bacteroidia bacterium]|nr:hypothetical protein [Bacteroidia bacterium]
MKHSSLRLWLLLLLGGLAWTACDKTTAEPPDNPFDSIVFPEPPLTAAAPDSASLVGLHEYIFSQSCAVPGCHDGNFEPDFRTVQSSYNSLVYQPVIKNTNDEAFSWRVTPGNAETSWLYYRVTTSDQILGRMPLYDNKLSNSQLKAIKTWIETGAPDLFGNPANLPNTQPRITSIAAFIDFGGLSYRVDTIRDGALSPFATLANRDMTIWIGVNDDSTLLSELANTRLLFSDKWDGFSNATAMNMSYQSTPFVVPDYSAPGQAAEFHWKVTFNTGQFPVNELTFMRFLTNDGAHAEDYEFPDDPHPLEYKLFMSFFIVP